jgi:hypothetical protein
MNLHLKIEEDKELRAHVKDLIKGQIKAIIKEDLNTMIKEELQGIIKGGISKRFEKVLDTELIRQIKEVTGFNSYFIEKSQNPIHKAMVTETQKQVQLFTDKLLSDNLHKIINDTVTSISSKIKENDIITALVKKLIK